MRAQILSKLRLVSVRRPNSDESGTAGAQCAFLVCTPLLITMLTALKVRMIKDIQLDKLKYRYFDGMAKLDPPYEP